MSSQTLKYLVESEGHGACIHAANLDYRMCSFVCDTQDGVEADRVCLFQEPVLSRQTGLIADRHLREQDKAGPPAKGDTSSAGVTAVDQAAPATEETAELAAAARARRNIVPRVRPLPADRFGDGQVCTICCSLHLTGCRCLHTQLT